MGNWGAALEGAASGLDSMTKLKMTEAELAYKEMAEQNRMRWQTEEAKKERDWKSSENFIDRDWRGTEAGKERDWKTSEGALDREVKREDLALGRERLEEEREYRRGVLADRERRTDAYEDKTTGSWSEENEQEATLEALQNLDEEEAKIADKTILTAEQRAAEVEKIQKRRDLIISYGATGAVAYERVNKAFGDSDVGREYAERFALMSPEDRAVVNKAYLEFRRQKTKDGKPIGARGAYARAIDSVSSGRPTDATDIKSSSNTDVEKSVGLDAEDNTGDVKSVPDVQSVSGEAPPKDFIGPPAPPTPKHKPTPEAVALAEEMKPFMAKPNSRIARNFFKGKVGKADRSTMLSALETLGLSWEQKSRFLQMWEEAVQDEQAKNQQRGPQFVHKGTMSGTAQ